ncbi:hypothetical protein F5J12DRAFT_889963 [Pisolithus orientalis]|uniref:uncharacterized protein n=1 Tax=Pisolithus orientalis TaxID=936130 RepID=UPI002224BC7C|nr:uncharacterized protein F5J12DRAFT_889963 [Pisolithus orientalis]KAI6019668.1 hypothetical protein F5J12DRAFT_889963 [Pisolithus orientalis]
MQPESHSCIPTASSTALSLTFTDEGGELPPKEPVDDTRSGGAGHLEREHPRSSPLPYVKKEELEERMDWRRTLPSPRHEVTNELSGELAHVKKRARSPSPLSVHPRVRARSLSPSLSEKEREREKDRDREHEQGREREKDKKPTQPFLPPIPRYEPRPKFSTTLAQEAEYARLGRSPGQCRLRSIAKPEKHGVAHCTNLIWLRSS